MKFLKIWEKFLGSFWIVMEIQMTEREKVIEEVRCHLLAQCLKFSQNVEVGRYSEYTPDFDQMISMEDIHRILNGLKNL